MPICCTLPRRAGKYAWAIRKAIALGWAIAVTRQQTKEDILRTAAALHLQAPEIVVIDRKHPRADPGVRLIFIDYDPTKEDSQC